MQTFLLGYVDPVGGANSFSANYICFTRYNAVNSGFVTGLYAYSAANGNIVAGIYTDNSGNPDSLLAQTVSVAMTNGNWLMIDLPAIRVLRGTYYWIAYNSSVANACQQSTGGTCQYVSYTYGALPSTAPGGRSTASIHATIQGYDFGVALGSFRGRPRLPGNIDPRR